MPAKDHYHNTVIQALYRAMLDYLGVDTALYMAVPEAAYHGILSEAVGQQALKYNQVRLIMFDPNREEIIKWID